MAEHRTIRGSCPSPGGPSLHDVRISCPANLSNPNADSQPVRIRIIKKALRHRIVTQGFDVAERTGLFRASCPLPFGPPSFLRCSYWLSCQYVKPEHGFSHPSAQYGDNSTLTEQKKPPMFPSGAFACGGADGTRTRDLRRDRPAF